MTIEVVQADITKLQVDAIVNAANKSLLGGGGVDGAIHAAAGAELLQKCKLLGGCNTGQAKLTKGYKLPAEYIIHTVGPIYRFHSELENRKLLADCYINSLDLAAKYNCHSVAFSCISTGVYGYPKKAAAEIAINTVKEWLINHHSQIKVIFCVFDDENKTIYQEMIK
ncbi:O-acetyl-ADP-ribose deacetylase (regulator of RNase III) [Lactobacillus colini]|uniref:O-acetyl-ADP-ribose deacetylase (Regulator of RNase III) n=1 Tax=Lactobacillus colini TaxID=1819254 RepID=A0ABS4MEV7_9LACO|nr:O-acetyl-ADP-ribose deacetylase [Lactobacillus colini]MBP2058184.1 O-acetyl-ADP-ribose deacetylase (regulator of RNase III) [Lactobacillus colini]